MPASASGAVLEIIEDVETAFGAHFPECNYGVFEIAFMEHLNVLNDGSASKYLDRYEIPSMVQVFGDVDVIRSPSARFLVADAKRTWTGSCFVEKSQTLENGLFLSIQTRLLEVESSNPFREKYDRIVELRSACLRALELEQENA